MVAKSKAEKKKQKRQAKKKQIKASRFQQTIKANSLFHLEDARYYYHSGNMDKALKSVKKAASALPDEEEIFCLMGSIGAYTGNTDLEISAMTGLERIGKINDDLRIDLILKLYELEKFEECSKKIDWALKNFTRFNIKNKRQVKAQIQQLKEYCGLIAGSRDKNNLLNNTPSSGHLSLEQTASLDKTKPLQKKTLTRLCRCPLPPKSLMFPSFIK